MEFFLRLTKLFVNQVRSFIPSNLHVLTTTNQRQFCSLNNKCLIANLLNDMQLDIAIQHNLVCCSINQTNLNDRHLTYSRNTHFRTNTTQFLSRSSTSLHIARIEHIINDLTIHRFVCFIFTYVIWHHFIFKLQAIVFLSDLVIHSLVFCTCCRSFEISLSIVDIQQFIQIDTTFIVRNRDRRSFFSSCFTSQVQFITDSTIDSRNSLVNESDSLQILNSRQYRSKV